MDRRIGFFFPRPNNAGFCIIVPLPLSTLDCSEKEVFGIATASMVKSLL